MSKIETNYLSAGIDRFAKGSKTLPLAIDGRGAIGSHTELERSWTILGYQIGSDKYAHPSTYIKVGP